MSTETPLDIKATINLTKTSFPQKANLGLKEPERLARWQAIDLYRLIREARKGAESFLLHDGPPYANADIHIGTALNKTLKDLVVKSHTMMGYDSPYVPGYDCHGLPIELFVDKKLGAKKASMPPATFRRICREHAANALKRQTADFQRLGILGEWDNPYLTMSNQYEAETARLFGKFVERGYVYKGARPVYWCIHDQTALAEAEVEYHEHTSPSVYVKFPLPKDQVEALEARLRAEPDGVSGSLDAAEGKPVFVLIWTTTPWTLPANIGIAVHPNYSYSAVDTGSEVFILATELTQAVAEKVGWSEMRTLASFPGRLLDKLRARHAWIDRPSLLMVGTHVTLGGEADAETELDVKDEEKKGSGKAGTGCVHTAPGHGHDDFVIGQEYREELEDIYKGLGLTGGAGGQTAGADPGAIYCPVGSDGRFSQDIEHFGGMGVFEANKPIVEFLRETGPLVFSEDYAHRYPHCWRCHNPVIFRATPQWFISMDNSANGSASLRAGALREVESVEWIPAWGRTRMRNMYVGRPDWCVSRQRLWGVPIPAFYCKDCSLAIIDPAIVEHVATIFEKETADVWYSREAAELLPDGFVCPSCSGSAFTKETDILDVWFESGTSSIAVLEVERKLPWPADVYLEGGDQFRGWFNSSLMGGLAAHGRSPYKTVVTHGWTVDGEGKQMHKSLGNAVPPDEVIKASGAEILRLWVASSNYQEDMRISPEIIKRQVDAYRKMRNTARFCLGNIYDFDPATDSVPPDEMWEIDRWALAMADQVTRKVVDGYRRFDYSTVYHAMYNFATVTLSATYFDVLKDRLYTFAPRSVARRSAQTALYLIGDLFARLLAPILSFTSDEIWEHLPGSRAESVHLALFPERVDGAADEQMLERWERVLKIRAVVQKSLEEKRTAKVIGASLEAKVTIRADRESLVLLEAHRDQLPALFIVSAVELLPADGDVLAVEVEHAAGRKCERCWNWSESVGADPRYPDVDARCVKQIEEGWAGGTK